MADHSIRTALIGAGFIGAFHARNLSLHPVIDLVSIVEPNEAVGTKLADQYRTTWTSDIDEALFDPSIEATWIASPAATHCDFIRRAASAGKAIFCEKPVGMDLADVDRMVGELKGYEKPIMIGFNRRFDPSHAALKAAIAAARIGKVEHVIITSRDPHPPPVAYMKATPGGIFYDTAARLVAIAKHRTRKLSSGRTRTHRGLSNSGRTKPAKRGAGFWQERSQCDVGRNGRTNPTERLMQIGRTNPTGPRAALGRTKPLDGFHKTKPLFGRGPGLS